MTWEGVLRPPPFSVCFASLNTADSGQSFALLHLIDVTFRETKLL